MTTQDIACSQAGSDIIASPNPATKAKIDAVLSTTGVLVRRIGADTMKVLRSNHMCWRVPTVTAIHLAALTLGCSNAIAQPCDGLAAYWALNGNAIDSSGNGNNGQTFGGSFGPGVAGDAFQMVYGSLAHAEFANTPSLNPVNAITVSGWWFSTSYAGINGEPIVDKAYIIDAQPNYQYLLGVVGDQYINHQASFIFAVGLNWRLQFVRSGGGVWQPGHWYHVAGTYDGAFIRLYVNGVVFGSSPATGQLVDYGREVRVGQFGNFNSSLPGAVDEVRIYNRALSAAEVAYLAAHPDGKPSVQPAAQPSCPGGSVAFNVSSMVVAPLSYQWRKDGNPIDIVANPSAATNTLTLTNVGPADVANYDCIVTNSCASVTSNAATLTICAAEFNCDGFIDFTDFDAFVTAFEAGAAASDFNGDGFLDFTDFDAFVSAFEAGC